MTVSGSKSVKKSQKFLDKSHKLNLKLISPNFFCLANLKYLNLYYKGRCVFACGHYNVWLTSPPVLKL